MRIASGFAELSDLAGVNRAVLKIKQWAARFPPIDQKSWGGEQKWARLLLSAAKLEADTGQTNACRKTILDVKAGCRARLGVSPLDGDAVIILAAVARSLEWEALQDRNAASETLDEVIKTYYSSSTPLPSRGLDPAYVCSVFRIITESRYAIDGSDKCTSDIIVLKQNEKGVDSSKVSWPAAARILMETQLNAGAFAEARKTIEQFMTQDTRQNGLEEVLRRQASSALSGRDVSIVASRTIERLPPEPFAKRISRVQQLDGLTDQKRIEQLLDLISDEGMRSEFKQVEPALASVEAMVATYKEGEEVAALRSAPFKPHALQRIVGLLADFGETERAIGIAQRPENARDRSFVWASTTEAALLITVAESRARRGSLTGAKDTVKYLSSPLDKASALIKVAKVPFVNQLELFQVLN